ncbi:12833_t:CDS:2 [Cetraspora pellucida]|uniref:12833_t:CDS:1 n=1 Tax=Cetraspora pellucida TaxID=1433469 RepID=A0A9N8ZH66_9GLOM|nr:12833_t:CDS:2 [Cetraspora pellucida]
MSVATLTRASNEISEINDNEPAICKLEKKQSKTRLSKVDKSFNKIKQDEKKDIKVENAIKQDDDEQKGIKVENAIKQDDDEQKGIKVENAIKQDDEPKDIKIEKAIKQDDKKKYIKIEKTIKQEDEKKGGKIEDPKPANSDYSTLTKQELLKLHKKLIEINKKLEQQNIEYEKLFYQQEEKIKTLQKEIKEQNKLIEENSLMKLHINNLNKELAGMENIEKQYDLIEDVKCSYFHSWFSYVPLASISSKIKSSPTLSENEDTHQKHFIEQFNSIYSRLTTSKNSKYSTHNTSYSPYLDGLKPDVSVTERDSKPTSSNVIIIGELKRVRLTKSHYEQVFNYGIKILQNQLPRKTIFAFLTNHQQIIFFKIQRKNSKFSCEHSLIYNFNYENIGWRMLMTLVQKDKKELGYISVC